MWEYKYRFQKKCTGAWEDKIFKANFENTWSQTKMSEIIWGDTPADAEDSFKFPIVKTKAGDKFSTFKG
jgi:hypothetical protein